MALREQETLWGIGDTMPVLSSLLNSTQLRRSLHAYYSAEDQDKDGQVMSGKDMPMVLSRGRMPCTAQCFLSHLRWFLNERRVSKTPNKKWVMIELQEMRP